MITALWILNAFLALAFIGTGLLKLVRSKEALAAAGLHWTDDFTAPQIRALGAAELVGATGLILPLATGIAPILAPVAAIALAILMGGAITTHVRRKENTVPSLVLGILSIVSAVLGLLVVLG